MLEHDEYVYYLFMETVSQIYAYAQTYQIVYIKNAQFLERQL